MSANLALTITANNNSLMALEAAREAKRIACTNLVNNYEHNKATIEQQNTYVDCISVLNPPINPFLNYIDPVTLKIIIVVALIGVIAGVVLGVEEGEDWPGKVIGMFCYGVLGGMLAVITAGIIALVFYAIYCGIVFLFTG